MKFENPIMNISMFEVENIVTEPSGPVEPTQQSAEEAVNTFIANQTAGSTAGGYKIVF